jgi:predicted DCC family thiol-disulfide oxidoreductase YuxK
MPNSTKVILYDDNCPMCQAYTLGFVQAGILPEGGRQCFSTAPEHILAQIDLDKARHEIPLYDTATGETIYGKQALFHLLSSRWTWMRPIFENRIFQAVVHQFYQIITYNRRIIAGSSAPETGFDCAPDFNWFYRTLYIGVAMLFACAMLLRLADFEMETFLMLLALPLFGLLSSVFTTQKMDFLGHWATIFLLTQILLLPFWWLSAPLILVFSVFTLLFGALLYRRFRLM